MSLNPTVHQSDQRCRKQKGFTLIELLVALAVASIMMAALAASYWSQTQASRRNQLQVEMQQNLRAAMYMLERDIMMAGYDEDDDTPPAATIVTALEDEFSFQFVDDTNTQITVTYDLYDANGDGDMDIGREVTGRPKSAVAENIEAIEFFYTLADGSQSLAPAPDLEDIRVVGISIIARTASETRMIDNATYTALSGASAGPFGDGFMRQIATAMVKCRNMGED